MMHSLAQVGGGFAVAVGGPEGEPYADAVRGWFQSSFPERAALREEDVARLLVEAVVGTGRTRLGPRPQIAGLAKIDEVVQAAVEAGQPVRYVVPWGSGKPDDSGPDLAEVFALQALAELDGKVRRVWEMGAVFALRLEDVSATTIYWDRRDWARARAARYTAKIKRLVDVLGLSSFVTVRPESEMQPRGDSSALPPAERAAANEAAFTGAAEAILPYMMRYIVQTDLHGIGSPQGIDALNWLRQFGWQGDMPKDQRDHYRHMYFKQYGAVGEAADCILAHYMTAALVRTNLGMRGELAGWGGDFLQLSFVAPVPGMPRATATRSLYWRTLPENITRNHSPAWRARGFFSMQEAGPRPQLAAFYNQPERLTPVPVVLSSAEGAVEIEAHYVVQQ